MKISKRERENINCFSNEENRWRNSKINFIDNFNIKIYLEGKFTTERGRINCSLRERITFTDGSVFSL